MELCQGLHFLNKAVPKYFKCRLLPTLTLDHGQQPRLGRGQKSLKNYFGISRTNYPWVWAVPTLQELKAAVLRTRSLLLEITDYRVYG